MKTKILETNHGSPIDFPTVARFLCEGQPIDTLEVLHRRGPGEPLAPMAGPLIIKRIYEQGIDLQWKDGTTVTLPAANICMVACKWGQLTAPSIYGDDLLEDEIQKMLKGLEGRSIAGVGTEYNVITYQDETAAYYIPLITELLRQIQLCQQMTFASLADTIMKAVPS